MASAALTALTLLSGLAIRQVASSPVASSPVAAPNSDGKPCTSFTVPVPVTVTQPIYELVHVNSDVDAASYEVDLETWNSPNFAERIIKNITFSKTFNIYTTLCVPPNGSKKKLLQVATHGGGFDHRYWDPEIEPEKYSYVDYMLEKGYSILIYDRLTAGRSDHPNAYTEGQLTASLQVLRSLTEIIRAGKLSKYASNSIDFDKIIHVGHSFGSFITHGLTTYYPDISDAAILTGWLPTNESALVPGSSNDNQYAPEADPQLFSDFSSGYIVAGTPDAFQVNFFSTRRNKTAGLGGFDPKVLDYAFSIRQPVTVSDPLSAQDLLSSTPTSPEYTGPVQFLSGEYDWLQCLGYCPGLFNESVAETIYPKAKAVDFQLQTGTGHVLPYHYGARNGFQKIFAFLQKNGF